MANCILNHSPLIIIRSLRQNAFRRRCTYVQGQSPEAKVREYFYYIDHQGMVISNDLLLLLFIGYGIHEI